MVLPWTLGNGSKKELLNTLPEKLHRSLGDELESLIVWGAFANPDADPDSISEPVDLLLVLSNFDLALIDSLSSNFESGIERNHLTLLVLEREELVRTTDVFPVRFLEMKQNYQVLVGSDVLKDIEIQLAHLRLRCEQELKNLKMRLIGRLVMDRNERHLLRAALQRCLPALESTLVAAANLVESEKNAEPGSPVETACNKLGLDSRIIVNVASQIKRISPATGEDLLVSLLLELTGFVDAAAHVVDAIPDSVEVVEWKDKDDATGEGESRWS